MMSSQPRWMSRNTFGMASSALLPVAMLVFWLGGWDILKSSVAQVPTEGLPAPLWALAVTASAILGGSIGGFASFVGLLRKDAQTYCFIVTVGGVLGQAYLLAHRGLVG